MFFWYSYEKWTIPINYLHFRFDTLSSALIYVTTPGTSNYATQWKMGNAFFLPKQYFVCLSNTLITIIKLNLFCYVHHLFSIVCRTLMDVKSVEYNLDMYFKIMHKVDNVFSYEIKVLKMIFECKGLFNYFFY